MRTTIDLPDPLYRTLKTRAAVSGVPLRELVQRLIEKGLRSPEEDAPTGRHDPPPVLVPPRGATLPALSRAEMRRLEEQEDEARHARSARR